MLFAAGLLLASTVVFPQSTASTARASDSSPVLEFTIDSPGSVYLRLAELQGKELICSAREAKFETTGKHLRRLVLSPGVQTAEVHVLQTGCKPIIFKINPSTDEKPHPIKLPCQPVTTRPATMRIVDAGGMPLSGITYTLSLVYDNERLFGRYARYEGELRCIRSWNPIVQLSQGITDAKGMVIATIPDYDQDPDLPGSGLVINPGGTFPHNSTSEFVPSTISWKDAASGAISLTRYKKAEVEVRFATDWLKHGPSDWVKKCANSTCMISIRRRSHLYPKDSKTISSVLYDRDGATIISPGEFEIFVVRSKKKDWLKPDQTISQKSLTVDEGMLVTIRVNAVGNIQVDSRPLEKYYYDSPSGRKVTISFE